MCGIVGYTGKRDAIPFLITGLQLLEYRGYDSAGVLVMSEENRPQRIRSSGYVSELGRRVTLSNVRGSSGIAHTRWATHGSPHESNAHPHTDTKHAFFVVHNGIIENHMKLREYLGSEVAYTSETDTEVLAHLIAHEYAQSGSVEEAFYAACQKIEGSYGLAVQSVYEPERIYFARNASPLLVGRGNGEMVVCSDSAPLSGVCTHMLYLTDGEMGYVTPARIYIHTVPDSAVRTREVVVPVSQNIEEKGEYVHYMQKEMYESPTVIRSALKNRLHPGVVMPVLEELNACGEWKQCKHVRFVACGTSYHAALYGKFIIESVSQIPVTVEIASEFRYKTYLPVEGEVVIAISQSGETADTRAGVLLAKEYGVPTIALVNVPHSTIAREADHCILLHAGAERSVASTKACISQSVVCALLALSHASDEYKAKELRDALLSLSAYATETLSICTQTHQALQPLYTADSVFCIGRGGAYAIALESALKLKEVAYVHAEGYPGGELKHGSLALIDATVPTLAFVSHDQVLQDKLLSNIAEIRSRGGEVIVVSCVHGDEMSIKIPTVSILVEPIIQTIAAHCITYAVGVSRGTPIDKPRNLAKAVTVE